MSKSLAKLRPIPKTLVIGGAEYTVLISNLEDRHGDCDVFERKIVLHGQDDLDQQWRTLSSEVVPACGLAHVLEEAVAACLDTNLWPLVDFL